MTAPRLAPPQSLIDTVRGLRAGFGVEDIAVKGRHPINTIRGHMRHLRERGVLTSIIRDGQSSRQRRPRA